MPFPNGDSAKPELGRESDALKLSGRALGDLGKKQDFARDFEVGKTLGRELAHVLLRQIGTLAQDHHGGDFFAKLRVRGIANVTTCCTAG